MESTKHSGGRPQGRKVNILFGMQVSPEEKKHIDDLFRESGARTKKKFIMDAIESGKIVQEMKKERTALLAQFAKIKSDLAHMGANINQVAKVVNTSGREVEAPVLVQQLAEMNEYLKKVESLSKKTVEVMNKLASIR